MPTLCLCRLHCQSRMKLFFARQFFLPRAFRPGDLNIDIAIFPQADRSHRAPKELNAEACFRALNGLTDIRLAGCKMFSCVVKLRGVDRPLAAGARLR